jgi:hypothetical protein
MKKYLAVLFSVIFLLSFTVTAFAIHEEMPPDEAVVAKGPSKITLGGKIIVRGWYFNNIDGTSPTSSPSQALYTTNAYLTVDAKVSDNVRAYMELETSSKESNNSGVLYWGSYDTKNDMELKFRQLWMQYTGSGILGVPTGIKAGHMPIALGEKIFLNNERFGDDVILVWVDPMKEMHIAAGTAKLVESSNVNIGSINHAQDLDGYVALMTYMLDKDTTVGANWTWAHSDANIPSLQYPVGTFTPVVSSLNFHNFGLHGNGKIAGLSYAAEADFQVGQAKNTTADTAKWLIDNANLHFKGYALFAKLGYELDMLKLRASFAMGSGDNGKDPSSVKEFQAMQGTDATGGIARFPHYTLLYERFIRTAAALALLTTNPDGNTRTTGIANTTYYNIGFDVKPMKQLNISLDGYLLEATKVGIWEQQLEANVSKGLGSEIDAKLNYQIAKNFSYFIEAGLFFPGNFYKDTAPLVNDASKKTATMAVHGLLLQF